MNLHTNQTINQTGNGTKPVRILLVDDDPDVRRALGYFLGVCDGFTLVGEANCGEDALEMLHSHQPDLVVVDYFMPGMDGTDLTRAIMAAKPEMKVIMLSSMAEGDVKRAALKAGAKAVLTKATPVTHLADVFLEVGRL